jgi:dTDP-4-dehydrorhamnose 3,5-epimerase
MGNRGGVIHGVTVRMLNQIIDERGKIMHFLKKGDKEFESFGEVYFSTIHSGINIRG